MPTIRIDDQVYEWLKAHARPFADTPNSVLRRMAQLDPQEAQSAIVLQRMSSRRVDGRRVRGLKTIQRAFRTPILSILRQHGGQARRPEVLKDLDSFFAKELTEYDRALIPTGGSSRWAKSAEFEIHLMRKQGLLEPAGKSGSGLWKLSAKGAEEANRLHKAYASIRALAAQSTK